MVWNTETKEVKRDIKEEVIAWFNRAKLHGSTEINLYYSPLNEMFNLLTDKRFLGKTFVGYEFEKHLYNVRAGSGDCEERLVYLGEI